MATLLAVSVKIREMHTAYTAKNSLDIDTINTLFAVFGTTTFRISLMNFFWEKLFTDDRNIFCKHIPLEWERKGKSQGAHSSPRSHSSVSLFRTRELLVDCGFKTYLLSLMCRVLRKHVKMRYNHIQYSWLYESERIMLCKALEKYVSNV